MLFRSYTASEWQAGDFKNEFDLLAGIRYTFYDLDLSGTVGPVPVALSETLQWLDGTLGMRVRGRNANGITYSLMGDIGVGSGLSAQAIGTIGKTWNYDSFDLNVFAGYRYLYQDWSGGDDAVDLATHGPLLGVKFTF